MAQSPECILYDLNLRAMESSKLANFQSALHDANAMQQLSPSSTLGYIRAAAIYSEQGKQLQVIDVCTKSLGLVDSNDALYATLQEARDDAIRRQNKRIDFVSELPVEIVITRLIPLFMDHQYLDSSIPYPSMHVSKVWRDRIHECFGGLRFTVSFDEDQNEERCSQLIQFAQHAKGLIIAWYSEATWLSGILLENNFCSLRDMHINGFANDHDTSFLSALKAISNTLTHLDISLSLQDDTLPTVDIVSACPNLVDLTIVNPFDADLSSLPMTTWPNMKTLSITHSQRLISSGQMVEISKRFPSLKTLRLSPCADGESALVVPQYLPSMTRLELMVMDSSVELTYTDKGYRDDQQGITVLSISSFLWTPCSDHHIIPLLKHYQKRLIELEWDIVLDIKDDAIYHIQYPHLQKLILDECGWWIPRNAPALEELEITSHTMGINSKVLDTIPPHLQILTLQLTGAMQLSELSAIERYFHRLAEETQLKELVVLFSSMHVMDHIRIALDAICCLNTLTRLQVGFMEAWGGYHMERFLDQLAKGCPQLSCLEINCNNAPSTHSLNTLKRLGSLKKMSFSITSIDDEDNFWNAIQTFSQLQCITIYPAGAVNRSYITHLNKQRPDMKIIVDTRYSLL